MSTIIGTSEAIVVTADGSGTQVIPTPANQVLVFDNFNRTVSGSPTAGFGTASSGAVWGNGCSTVAWPGGTKSISVNGSYGVISVNPTSGTGAYEWADSVTVGSAFEQSGAQRELYITWYVIVNAASGTAAYNIIGGGFHGAYASDAVGSWCGDGTEAYGGFWSLSLGTSGSPSNGTFGASVGNTVGGGGSVNSSFPWAIGTEYAVEVHMSDALGTFEWRIWASAGTRPTTPISTGSLAPSMGPVDGVSCDAIAPVGTTTVDYFDEIDITLAVPGG